MKMQYVGEKLDHLACEKILFESNKKFWRLKLHGDSDIVTLWFEDGDNYWMLLTEFQYWWHRWNVWERPNVVVGVE